MKSAAVVSLIIACMASCRESGKQDVAVQVRDQAITLPGPVSDCSARAAHRVGDVEIQPVSLGDAIRELQGALDRADTRVLVTISTEYHDFDGLVSLKRSDSTLGALADELSQQIGGRWDLQSGKGCFLVFRHPDDTASTVFSADPSNKLGSGEFVLPE